MQGKRDEFVYAVATSDDAAELTATVLAGFETYRAFAPAGWDPPPEIRDVDAVRRRLSDADAWCLAARTRAEEPVGHVSFVSSMTSRWPEKLDDLAHLWQLFVRPPFWGSGAATTLMRRAIAEAGAQGYTAMRLYTPADQPRARRFYEREGFVQRADPIPSDLGFPVVEYRRSLGGQ
jgi:ribosomal protein S18 acetylase RimI-like enzyme